MPECCSQLDARIVWAARISERRPTTHTRTDGTKILEFWTYIGREGGREGEKETRKGHWKSRKREKVGAWADERVILRKQGLTYA